MQKNVEEYMTEKERREKRLMIYTEEIQKKCTAEFRTGHSEAGRGEASSAYDTAGNCGYYRNMPLESCEI